MPNKFLSERLKQLEKDVDAMLKLSTVSCQLDASRASPGARAAASCCKQARCLCPAVRDRTVSRERKNESTSATNAHHSVPGARPTTANSRNCHNSSNNSNNSSNNNSVAALKQKVPNRAKSESASRLPVRTRTPHFGISTRGRKSRGGITSSEECTAFCNKDKSHSDVVSEISSPQSSGSSNTRDDAGEKFDTAIRQLHSSDDENSKLREMLDNKEATIKDLSHSKAVALNLAKQFKEKYDDLKSEFDRTLQTKASRSSVGCRCGASEDQLQTKKDKEQNRVLSVLKDIATSSRDGREPGESEAVRRNREELEASLARKEEENEKLRCALEDKKRDDSAQRRYLQEREMCEELLRKEAAEKEELARRQVDELTNSLRQQTKKIAELTEANIQNENLLAIQQKSLVNKARSEEILNRVSSMSKENISSTSGDQTVDNYKEELMHQKCKIDNLVEALTELDAMCIDAQQRAHHFEMEVNALQAQIQSAEKMYNDLRSEKDRKIEKLSAALKEREKKMSEFHDVQHELKMAEKSLTKMAAEIGNLKAALREMKSDEKELKALRKRCEREMYDKENEIRILRTSLSEMDNSDCDGKLLEEREICVREIESKECELRSMTDAISELERRSPEGARAEAERAAARKIAEAERCRCSAEKRVKDVGRRLAETEKKLAEAECRVAEADRKLNEAEARLVDAEERLKDMGDKMMQLEEEAKEACDCAKEAASREAELQDMTQRLTISSKTEIHTYKSMLESNVKENKELIKRCKDLEAEIKRLEQNIEILEENEEKRCKCQGNAMEELKNIAIERETKLQTELMNVHQRCEELKAEVEELRSKIGDLDALNKHQESLLAMQQQVITNKDEHIQMANKEVDQIRKRSTDLDSHLKNLRQSFETFEANGGAEKLEAVKQNYEKSLGECKTLLDSEKAESTALRKMAEEKAVLIEMLKDDLKEKSEQLAEVVEELNREKQASGKVKEKLDDLRGQIEVRELELTVMKMSVVELETRGSVDSGMLAEEKDRLKIKDKIIEDQTQTIRHLKEQTKPLEREIASMKQKNAQLLNEIQELKWMEDDLRAQLDDLEEVEHLEKSSNKETSEEFQRQSKILNELESQMEMRQTEWESVFSKVLSEKESAENSARYATRKLVETVTSFKRQIDTYQKTQHSLACLVREKESLLLEASKQQIDKSNTCCPCVDKQAQTTVAQVSVSNRAKGGNGEQEPVKILLATREQRGKRQRLVERRLPCWGSGDEST